MLAECMKEEGSRLEGWATAAEDPASLKVETGEAITMADMIERRYRRTEVGRRGS